MPARYQGSSPTAENRKMNAVGIFAGRGDVILGMTFALLFGVWIGYQLCRFRMWLTKRGKE